MKVMVWVAWIVLASTACATTQTSPSSHSSVDPATQVIPVDQRSPAPHLHGTTLDGDAWALSDELGQGLVAVNVWASWCGPCRSEMPLLARAAAGGVRVIGIVEHDTEASARAFAASRGATYPSLYDPNGALLAQLPMLPQVGIPSTLFLDRQGLVAARVVGPVDADTLGRIVRQLGGS
ncbi:MAG: TlpA disulfide reductase family protein [Nocardioidaceae bacterium]